MEKVVVTGLGSISSLGLDTSRMWRSLMDGESGISQLRGFSSAQLKVSVGAQVRGFEPDNYFPSWQLSSLDRSSQFALVATKEAIADSGLDARAIGKAAAIIGTGCGGKETDELSYQALYKRNKSRLHPLTIPRGMPSSAASQISMEFGLTGPVFCLSSACSSANHAIIQAALMIRSGMVDVAVTGGTDAPFTFGLLKAWEALRVLSQDTCRPFSHDRSGLVLGEGAGIIVLESAAHARKRSARIYCELAGGGMSADAGHITDPSVEGAVRAISAALKDAGLDPNEVDYINAHGTGTQANDVSETRAIRLVLGERANSVAVSSTKSTHGHVLGASGALELIATILAMRNRVVPATMNFTHAGEGCDLDYVPNQPRAGKITAALSNSFAFGGLNAVVALRAY